MPFKVEILDHVDEIEFAAKTIGAANTIVNNDGHLIAYNTDWIGVYKYLLPNKPDKLFILGNGGFAKAVEYACNQLDIPYEVITRKDWDKVPTLEGTIFNATPVDVEVKGTLIDGRPFTESGKQIAALQAEEQYRIYKEWI
jgi:shikimate 5-dehydrogenase